MFRQLCILYAWCFLLCAGTLARAADPLAISGASIVAPGDPLAVPKYGKVELVVTLAGGTYTRLYDPRPSFGGLDLQATFIAPDASQQTAYGFFDGTVWRVRFAPTQVGAWTFSVSAQDNGGTASWAGGSFRCVVSGSPGFARIDNRNLRFAEGSVLYAIGANNGWQYDVEQPAFSTLAAQGINLMSFWMNSPWIAPGDPQPRAPIENITDGIGIYNQPACTYLDGVVARAEAAGVYLLPTIWSHGNLRQTGTHGWGSGWWDNLAYRNVCSATDFFKTASGAADTPQWTYQKNFYRYMLARWGYSRAIVGWVTLCEIEGTTGYAGTAGANPAQATAWCSAVRDYLAANDPYRLNGATYPAAVSKTDWSADATTWSNGCNLAAMDSYTQQQNNVGIASTIAAQTTAMRNTGRPAFHAEFGGQAGSGATEPMHMHNGLWAGTAAGACLAPLKWCDGGSWPLLTDASVGTMLQDNLKFLAQFTGSIDYVGAAGFTAATLAVTPSSSRGWGMRLSDRGFAWIQNTSGSMGGQSVAISTLAAGTYQVTWYDTWKSAADQTLPASLGTVGNDGVLSLSVPALARNDIAVRFVRQANRPPVAGNQSLAVLENTPLPITLSATDPDGDLLTYRLVRQPGHGSVTGAPPNVTYTPDMGFSGEDSFSFLANDGRVDSAEGTVSIQVTANSPVLDSEPWAEQNELTFPAGTIVHVTASNPGGGALTYAWSQLDGPLPALFATPNAADSAVSFRVLGIYRLRVTVANDKGFRTTGDVAEIQVTGDPTLALSPTAWTPTKSGGMQTVTVTSNSAWTATSNQDWLTLSAGNGIGNGTVTLTASANPTALERTGAITLKTVGAADQTVAVTQAPGDPALAVSPTTWSVAAGGGTQAVGVTSNSPWTVASDQSWLSLSVAEGNGNGSTILTAEANPTFSTRRATVTFAAATLTRIVTVTQAPQNGLLFSQVEYSVKENGATAVLAVNRMGNAAGTATVAYKTTDGTAKAGVDYTARSGVLTFAAGVASQIISIPVANNQTYTGNRNFAVELSNPTAGTVLGSPATATVTIQDDDISWLRFGATSYAVAENVTGGKVTLTVTRPGNTGPVSVKYTTQNGTARAGMDYVAVSGTLSFTTELSKTFTVSLLNNTLADGLRSFTIALGDPSAGAEVGTPASATLTIADDDKAGTIQFAAVAASIVEGGGTLLLGVTRTGGTASGVTVDYATADGTATTADNDYAATAGTLTFAANESSKTIAIPITPDLNLEPNETFTVTLGNPGGGGSLGTSKTATVTIANDDVAGTLQVAATTVSVAENAGRASVTVIRTVGSAGSVSVNYSTSNGTALAGMDYTATAGTLVFGPGETSQTISVPILDNTVVNTNKAFKITLSSPTGGAKLGTLVSTTVSIVNNDLAGKIQFSPTAYAVGEGDGSVVLTVMRTGGEAGGVTVNYATGSSTAQAGRDYVGTSGKLSFAAGETTKTITIPILNDTLFEANETFKVTLSSPTGGATVPSAGASATVTIVSDDLGGMLGFSSPAYSVGEADGSIPITVIRTGGLASGITVKYAAAVGTASSTDFKPASGTLTFGAGETSKTFTVMPINNTVAKGDRTVKLTLSSPTGSAILGSPATAVLTIIEDDAGGGLGFSQEAYSVQRPVYLATPVTITVKRTGGLASGVTVKYATLAGTAVAAKDYTATSGTLSFAAGETSKTFTVAILKNALAAGTTKTLSLLLSAPTGGASLGTPNPATLDIVP
jgi:hypothetical protein